MILTTYLFHWTLMCVFGHLQTRKKNRFLIYESLTKILGFYIDKITGTAASDNKKNPLMQTK